MILSAAFLFFRLYFLTFFQFLVLHLFIFAQTQIELMKSYFSLAFICLCFTTFFAQSVNIKGKIFNDDDKPLENATVYLLKGKDSSIINYTSSSKDGNFTLKTDKFKESILLKINADKYKEFSKTLNELTSDLNLEKVNLEKDDVKNIEGVVIKAAPPVKIKNDTIEFNASKIKLRPDSKIEELLKQLPGVEISNEGKVTVNGKEADQIMVNGKPFFDKDGKIALKNLPADIIKSVQFTTTKTKEEELSGKKPQSQNVTVNFNIDEKKNKGLLTRITLGYGSDKRYEGSALASYFNKERKISLLASSNNINSSGFSNDEIFDSMGSGRNSWLMQGGTVVSENGNTYYTKMSGNSPGIQKSTTVGLNYSDKIDKNAELERISVMYANNNSESRSKVNRTTLLQDYVLKTQSEYSGEVDNRQLNFENSIRVKLDSLTNFYFSPMFTSVQGTSINKQSSSTFRDNTLLNTNDSYTKSDTENNNFGSNFYFSKRLKKKGRVFSADMNSQISQNSADKLTISKTEFYLPTISLDSRNQKQKNKTNSDNFSFGLGYTEPVTDSLSVSLSFDYRLKNTRDSRNVNSLNNLTGDYDDLEAELSNSMNQKINSIVPELGISYNKKKFDLWLSASLNIANMELTSYYNNSEFNLNKKQLLPEYNLSFNYKFTPTKSFNIYSSANYNIPNATQLTPYEDTISPLNTIIGNPNLKTPWRNNLYMYFNNFNITKNLNYYFNLSFNYTDNFVTTISNYDDSGKLTSQYTNVDGIKFVFFSANVTKTFKWGNHKLSISPRFNTNFSYQKGFVNSTQYTSNVYSINPGLNFTYELKDKITFKPSYSLGYKFSDYKNYLIDKAETSTNQFKIELTNYFLKSNLVIGNDFEYNTNSNIAPGFKRDFYFWNTSVGYSFFNKQLTAKVKVYDVLNQNQSVRRMILDTYFEDREDLILKRYIMFSLSYKFNKFGAKK